ncbi:MAG: PilN domain-containing protein [Candidatus Kerfeldbacteria bacterium]|nr:PilN domain-containing protein [Candidatus Kerfeldbacteria bacterium]
MQKKQIQLEWYGFVSKNILFITVSVLAITSIVIIFSITLLDNQANNLDAQIEDERIIKEDGKLSTINDATATLNTTIERVRSIQKNYISWTDFLTTFSTLIPKDITINSISIVGKNQEINISGSAPTRESYQNLLKALESTPLLSNVQSPISNLVQRENITFAITAQITPEELYE